MFDLGENNDISVTPLDEARLKDLEVNGVVDGECGMWRVFRNKNDFLVTVDTDKIHKIEEFKTIGEVIHYLIEQ